MKIFTDKQRINNLQKLTIGYGKGWICRYSTTQRGLRIHESSHENSKPTIREAIDDFLNSLK